MVKETPVEEVSKLLQFGITDAEIIRRLTEQGYSPVQISDALNQAKIKQEITPSGLAMPVLPPLEAEEKPIEKPAELPVPTTPVPKPTAAPPVPTPEKAPPRPKAPPVAPAPPAEEYYPYQYPTYPTYPEAAAPAPPKIETEAIEEIAEEIVNEKWEEIKTKISDVIEWKVYAEKRISSIDDRIKRIELSLDRLQAALLAKVQEYSRGIKDLGSEMHSLESAFGKILSPLVENVKELSKITEDLKAKAKKAKEKPKPAIKKKK